MDVSIQDPNFLYYDNLNNVHIARNLVFRAQAKHIEVHYHFIRECVMARDVDLRHISMSLQTTDIFTKAMGADKLRQFMKNLGLLIVDQPSLGGSEAPILDEQS